MACAGMVCAQDTPLTAGQTNGVAVERNLETLETLAASLAEAVTEREALLAEKNLPVTGEDREFEIDVQVELMRERIRQLRRGFRDIIGGAEAAEFEDREEVETSIQDQLTEVIKPILSALQEPTSRLREMDNMREARDIWQQRRDDSERVIERIIALEAANLAGNNNPSVATELASARRQWEARRSEASGQF